MLIWLNLLLQICNNETSSLLGSLCEKQLDFRNYFRLCDTIRADEQIKSMFRLEGKAIDCPLTVNSNPPNKVGKNTNTAFQLTYRYFTNDYMAVSLFRMINYYSYFNSIFIVTSFLVEVMGHVTGLCLL